MVRQSNKKTAQEKPVHEIKTDLAAAPYENSGIKLFEDGDAYDEREITRLTLNLLRHTRRESDFASRLFAGFEQEFNIKGFPTKATPKGDYYFFGKKSVLKPVNVEDWNLVTNYLETRLAKIPAVEPDAMSRNLAKLGDYLGLDDTGKAVLNALYILDKNHTDTSYFKAIVSRELVPDALALMLDCPKEKQKIARMLSFNGPLLSYGLAYYDDESDSDMAEPSVFPELDGFLWCSLSEDDITEAEIVGTLLGKPGKTELNIRDFRHFGKGVETATDIIGKAIETGETGINVLIYGGAGLGKTQLAYVMAKHLNADVYGVGEDDNDLLENPAPHMRKKTTSEMRMAQLKRSQALLKGNRKAFLLFDEVEDLLIKGDDSSKKADTESKIGTNRMLERNPVATVWIGNNPEKFHEAVRQRFSFALRAVDAPTLIRKDIWDRQLRLHNVTLPDDEVLDLARRYSAPPRLIGDSIRAMRLTGGGREVVEETLRAKSEIVFGHKDAVVLEDCLPKSFSPSLINFTVGDLQTVDALIERGAAHKPFSLLIKQENRAGAGYLVRHMAENMTMNLLEVTAEQLLTPTPKSSPADNIRNAFQLASDENAFLVINNAEALAANEAKLVLPVFNAAALHNQLPYAIVAKKGKPLPDSVDRLFSDRLALGALDAEQCNRAYVAHFSRAAPASLAELRNLSIETFADVGNVLRFHGGAENTNDESIVRRLKRQATRADTLTGFQTPTMA